MRSLAKSGEAHAGVAVSPDALQGSSRLISAIRLASMVLPTFPTSDEASRGARSGCPVPCAAQPQTHHCREKHRPDKSEEHAQFMRRATSSDLTTALSSASMEQELVYEKLPKDIAQRHVLLMDPILATGHSAERAINVGFVPCSM